MPTATLDPPKKTKKTKKTRTPAPASDVATAQADAEADAALPEEAPAAWPRLTVERYHQMIDAGAIRDGANLELIRGFIIPIDKSAKGENPMSMGVHHRAVVTQAVDLGGDFRARGCHLAVQVPVTLPTDGEPEPDLSIIRGRPSDYFGRKPLPADVLCVVEVADSSLEFDQTLKRDLYAAENLPVYVIVNLPDRQIEVFADPADGAYRKLDVLRPGDTLLLPTPGEPVPVPVDDWLPPED